MKSAVPTRWRDILDARKSIFGWPDWVRQPVRKRTAKQALAAGERPFSSTEAERTERVFALSDTSGVVIEGVRLRLTAWMHRPLSDLTATLEVLEGDRWVCISRIDAWPLSPHSNIHWRKLQLPPEVVGSHIHRLEDNAKIGIEAFTPFGNLPAAVPLDRELQSFRDFARTVSVLFGVDGLEDIDAPEWAGRLPL